MLEELRSEKNAEVVVAFSSPVLDAVFGLVFLIRIPLLLYDDSLSLKSRVPYID